jgi:hypothetical protein
MGALQDQTTVNIRERHGRRKQKPSEDPQYVACGGTPSRLGSNQSSEPEIRSSESEIRRSEPERRSREPESQSVAGRRLNPLGLQVSLSMRKAIRVPGGSPMRTGRRGAQATRNLLTDWAGCGLSLRVI